MNIVVTSTGSDFDAAVDPKFGRCAFFALVDTDANTLIATPNPFQDASGGAGTQAAQWVLTQGATALLTGHCGPKAAAVLEQTDVCIVTDTTGTVREAVAKFISEING
ncbi:hypothetical protein CKO12_09410 [Chromatium okenii]|uniref:NifB/NifX family molybdenum-iron cluster-binding protein n=1 Tax=Chromatium okenii TaxID=61644 RepID=UPI001903D332|nr:NifB/NifX family molybdenum-iron cluster-binding protein [Chromatium okenii]MBK1642088.1 hypothetical protein [Chromatium okenii]